MLFANKIPLVTGSGRGAHVVVNFFRHREPAKETVAAIRALGRQTLVVRANVGDQEAWSGCTAKWLVFVQPGRPHDLPPDHCRRWRLFPVGSLNFR
ncbi:MAG: hypothetical protein IPM39_00870 [Chloroflexi bacterium]|nr:hypothetical protein [Chloroflexota bacterium]